MRLAPTVAVVAAGIAIAGTATGITYAATSGSTTGKVIACRDAKGVLALLNSHGHCPAHFVKVAINEQGPRGPRGPRGPIGPAGPGAVRLAVRSSGGAVSKESKPIAGSTLTVQVLCNPDDNAQVYINLNPPGSPFIFEGTAGLAGDGGSGSALWLDPVTDAPKPATLGPTSKSIGAEQSATLHSVEFTSNSGSAPGGTVVADVLVTQGSHMFTVQLAAYQDPTHCFAQAMVTPAG